MATNSKPALNIQGRQLNVVYLVAAGWSDEEIAAELGIKPRTVKFHTDALRWKLGIKHRREIPITYMRLTGDDPYPRLEEEGK